MQQNLREQQRLWKLDNNFRNPASETEFLDTERNIGHLAMKLRPRILGAFTAYIADQEASITDRLHGQHFTGVTFIGAVSSLLGQESLHAQGLWYLHQQDFDWHWAKLENVSRIELRSDKRFRGGAPCLWLTTPIAEYALGFAHPAHQQLWESTLSFFGAPHVDAWPREGYRPDWWPAESSALWPGEHYEGEVPTALTPQEELQRMTESLSVEPTSSGTRWKRLGPAGDTRFPGQPAHHLCQLEPWALAFDAGIKVTPGFHADPLDSLEGVGSDSALQDEAGKRKGNNREGRRTRARR